MSGTIPVVIFETPRLSVRRAAASDTDIAFFHRLWTNPEVMRFVGFPFGLRITSDDIRKRIENEKPTEFDSLLIVQTKNPVVAIGECKLGAPGPDGISETDVKLLPHYWGNGYGTEIKRALIAYLFTRTRCRAIRATPNQTNIASQKMQEAVGGQRVDEGIHRFPAAMNAFTCPVPYYVYMVFREDWEKQHRP